MPSHLRTFGHAIAPAAALVAAARELASSVAVATLAPGAGARQVA